ncbi:hypothetical protein DL95DRAFT_383855 [Leptodontidium sp. 2 PMI_412]|nr:hypothetical protein DL95DRAFT_383855 [Leptodontidium sp. 2 PMI_412]
MRGARVRRFYLVFLFPLSSFQVDPALQISRRLFFGPSFCSNWAYAYASACGNAWTAKGMGFGDWEDGCESCGLYIVAFFACEGARTGMRLDIPTSLGASPVPASTVLYSLFA